MAWEVEVTDECKAWIEACDEEDQDRIFAAIKVLERDGPSLRRPHVGNIHQSRHQHMKELIPRGKHIRILFAFDSRRQAILLIGGDKTNRWQEFYDEFVPIADDLYDTYLDELRKEGVI